MWGWVENKRKLMGTKGFSWVIDGNKRNLIGACVAKALA